MRPAVLAAFHSFSTPLEGRCPFLYLDSADPGLVTVGVGNLVEPVGVAMALPFVRPDGSAATRTEIFTSWQVVKGRQDLRKHGGMVYGGLKGNELRLTSEAIDALVASKLDAVDRQLAAKFDDWEHWPADAQLALLSWAWAVGAVAKYPNMVAALRMGDFVEASKECTINPQRGTIIERNARNRTLLRNAGYVMAAKLNPEALYWPQELAAIDQATVDTEPELPDLTDPDSDPEGETRLDTPIAKTTSSDRPSIIVEPMCLEDPALDED